MKIKNFFNKLLNKPMTLDEFKEVTGIKYNAKAGKWYYKGIGVEDGIIMDAWREKDLKGAGFI